MADFMNLIFKRQSVRRFSDQPVEKEKLDLCLESFRQSPSACNSQPWHVIVVDDPDVKKEVAQATFNNTISFNKFVTQAPIIIVIVLEKGKVISRIGSKLKDIDYPLIDIGVAAEHLCLQATELGLGTCMLGWFNEKKIKKTLSIPSSKKIGLLIALGYAEEDYRQRIKIRKTIDEIVSFNKYNK